MPLTEDGESATAVPFPAIWLRDNCPCGDCRDPLSGQKLFQITDLAYGLEVATFEQNEDTVTVTFTPDAHRSVFSRQWLSERAEQAPGDGRTERDKRLWRGADFADGLPTTQWTEYCSDGGERLRVLREVADLGFAIVRGAPTTERTVIEIARTFGFVRETNYGELFDVRVELAPGNLAFTEVAISPHTDNPYRDPVPTMQLLHCLRNAVEGGESILVDGFEAAATLRAEDPGAFGVLTSTLVPFAWSDASTTLTAERPLIETDSRSRVRGVRFNNRSMQALRLAKDDLVTFYESYRSFAEVIRRPELQLTFRLEPGDCVLMDNTRVLHARAAFSDTGGGARHLQGCYSDLDGLLSTIAILGARLGRG